MKTCEIVYKIKRSCQILSNKCQNFEVTQICTSQTMRVLEHSPQSNKTAEGQILLTSEIPFPLGPFLGCFVSKTQSLYLSEQVLFDISEQE